MGPTSSSGRPSPWAPIPSPRPSSRPMSRSSLPVSNTELPSPSPQLSPLPSRVHEAHPADRVPQPARRTKSFSTQFAAAVRWLHIYVSLLGFTALIFFAVTGVTLNHPTWFGADASRVTEFTG